MTRNKDGVYEDWRWYVRREFDNGAECWPCATQEEAETLMERRAEKVGYALYVKHVNVARLAVHPRMLPQDFEDGKAVPAVGKG